MRSRIAPTIVINAVAMTANITSAVTVLQAESKVSYDIAWSGTSPVGTLSVQVSNTYSLNPNGSVNNAGSWNTLVSSSVSGNTGTAFFDVITGAYAVRLIYTYASGTGTLNATVAGKVS